MSQEPFSHIPQRLLDVFANYTMDLPPLPKNALPVLSSVGDRLFATGTPPGWIRLITPTSISFAELKSLTPPIVTEMDEHDAGNDDASDISAEKDDPVGERPYFLCGFSGRGLQNRVFLYLYCSQRLRVGICLPFDCAYADPELERGNVARAMELLLLLLQCTREGASLNLDGAGTLYWVHDRYGSSFQVCSADEEIMLEGTTVDALLDYLECCRSDAPEENVASRFWLRV